jgi:hypothetical protein
MMRRFLGALVACLLFSAGLTVATTVAAVAHTGVLSGTVGCDDDGTSWWIIVKVDITNTPSYDTAETKATSSTAGDLDRGDGGGVNSGSQVILNAWYEHRANWPGVKTRMGNWSDTFAIINIPVSVESVTAEVQVDWKKWESRDYRKSFSKPSGCKPRPPQDEKESRTVVTPATCDFQYTKTVTEERSRTQVWNSQLNMYEWGAWSDWMAVSTTFDPVQVENCTPPPTDKIEKRTNTNLNCVRNVRTTIYQQREQTKGVWSAWHTTKTLTVKVGASVCGKKHTRLRLHIVDRCRCKNDRVWLSGTRRVTMSSVNQNKNTWRIHVVADAGYLVPKNIKHPNRSWVKTATYVVHTSNKACPCEKSHSCKFKPKPKPKPPCGCRP